jgi:hypothetical protein
MAWFTKLAYPGLAVHIARRLTGTRSLASSTTITAAQAKILRAERERERAALQSSEVNYDGPYSAPEMKTAMPGPKSRVLIKNLLLVH